MKKTIFVFAFRILATIILLVFLFSQVDLKSLAGVMAGANKPLLLLSFVIFCFVYVFCLLRWEMILKALKIHLSFKRIMASYCGGIFFNLFMPSTIGGDLMRSIDLSAHTKKPGEVVATVFLDRLSGYVGLVFLALISLCFGWGLIQDTGILFAVVILVLILAVVLPVLFNNFIYSRINKLLTSANAGKIREILRTMHQEIHYFRRHKKVIAQSTIFSLFVQAIPALSFYVVALALGIKLNLLYFFVFVPIITAITLLPVSIGGLGLRDAASVFLFAKIGVGKDFAFAMSLLNFSFMVIAGIMGGLVYVFTLRYRKESQAH